MKPRNRWLLAALVNWFRANHQSLSLESVRSEALPYVDREDAVNLARNWLDSQGPNSAYHLTPKGIKSLCEAVMNMDAALQSPARVAEGVEPKETVSDNELSLTELIATLDRRQYSRAWKVTLNGDEYHQLRNAALCDVKNLLPWPKVDLRTLVKTEEKDVHSTELRK